ncbi:MAG: class I SAM-dependent methyltransferase [Pyrinomonadaceae bacterium]
MDKDEEILRERMKAVATEYIEKGDFYGWFDAVYRETEEDSEQIPWVDMEPNRYFLEWNETAQIKGNGRNALVVGCGLGDEARFLYDAGFDVTAFDVSEKAIEIAKRIHADTDIKFIAADLFDPPKKWEKAFEFVLEVYTIQALPMSLREKTIDAIAGFVAGGGELVVVQRFRENDEEPESLPWPVSPKDLSRFEKNGLTQTGFSIFIGDIDDEPVKRFVVEYTRK